MKLLLVLLVLISVSVSATELELRVSSVTYIWGDIADFPLTSYQVGVTEYVGSTGFRVMYGLSDRQKNTLGSRRGRISEQMKHIWVMNIHHKFQLSSSVSAQVGYNYTEYKSCSNAWGCNPDTGSGIALAIQKEFSDHMAVKLSYDELYQKDSLAVGKEITNSYGVSIVYTY